MTAAELILVLKAATEAERDEIRSLLGVRGGFLRPQRLQPDTQIGPGTHAGTAAREAGGNELPAGLRMIRSAFESARAMRERDAARD